MDMKNLVREAQKMQLKMQQAQNDLEKEIVRGESGGGAVIVHSNCKGKVQKIKINRNLVSADDDVEILEDLILVALNDAKKKSEVKTASHMSSLGLPNNLAI
tara:strand:- start:1500 stop:1805 length:306 start_codon:yes stop_codon:yes gene_type:complete